MLNMHELDFYITVGGVQYYLDVSPDGWNSEAIKWSRSMKYWGMFRNFSIPLQFVKKGALLLRAEFYVNGINGAATLQVNKRNKQTNIFEEQYNGTFDFSTFKDKYDFVEITCIEGGLSADVQRRESTKYAIPFPTGHRTMLNWSGQVSNFETFNWVSPVQRYDDEVVPGTDSSQGIRFNYIAFQENNFKDINEGAMHFEDYGTGGTGWYGALLIDRECDLRLKWQPGSREVQIKTLSTVGIATHYGYYEYMELWRDGVHTILAHTATDLFLLTADNEWQSFFPSTVVYDQITGLPLTDNRYPEIDTFHVLPGDKIVWVARIEKPVFPSYYWRFNNNSGESLEIEIYDKLKDTQLPAWKSIDLFAAIADKIGGYPVKSDFLTANHSLIVPALSIRERLTPENVITQTSLIEFFDAINVTEEVGMGVEVINGIDTLVIERLDHFLSNSISYDIGHVTNFELSVQQDLIPSEINIGFNYTPNDDYYGRLEYNGNATFLTPSQRLTNELSLISPYRADILGIDKLRLDALLRTLNSSTEVRTKDTNSDNLNWICDTIYVSSDTDYDYYELNREYDITGVYWPESQANIRFTPKRCLLRHSVKLSSIFQLMTGVFTFAAGSKNFWISTEHSSETSFLFERYPFDIPTTDKTFYPFTVTFNGSAKWALISGLDVNNYGLVSFEYRGVKYYGYVIESAANLSHDTSGTYTLLLANYGNTLSNLIR